MELILVVVIRAGMAGNSQNGVSRSLSKLPFPVNKLLDISNMPEFNLKQFGTHS